MLPAFVHMYVWSIYLKPCLLLLSLSKPVSCCIYLSIFFHSALSFLLFLIKLTFFLPLSSLTDCNKLNILHLIYKEKTVKKQNKKEEASNLFLFYSVSSNDSTLYILWSLTFLDQIRVVWVHSPWLAKQQSSLMICYTIFIAPPLFPNLYTQTLYCWSDSLGLFANKIPAYIKHFLIYMKQRIRPRDESCSFEFLYFLSSF